jgi:hypothetical protein
VQKGVVVVAEGDRVLLFKNPTGGSQYAQALLTVFCAPPQVTVKLTTYRRLWISEDIFKNPKVLENRKALMICVDAERDKANKWWVKNFCPIREVIIKKSEIEGDYLALWVEVQGYIKCKDYGAYSDELMRSLQIYPPDEKSYIAFDTIRDLDIVDINNQAEMLAAWQSLVETLAGLKAFERAAFYTLTGVKRKKDQKKVDFEKTGILEPTLALGLVGNEEYVLTISHLLPFHNQREKLGRLEIELHMPESLKSDKDIIEVFGRHGSHDVAIKSKAIPSAECSIIEIYPKDPSFKFAPLLSIPVRLSPVPLWKRSLEKSGLIIATCIAVFFYTYGQLIQATKSYPDWQTFGTVSPELIGATLSALTLIVIPILVSLLIAGGRKD